MAMEESTRGTLDCSLMNSTRARFGSGAEREHIDLRGVGEPAHARHIRSIPFAHVIRRYHCHPGTERICLCQRRVCVFRDPAGIEYFLHWGRK
jgi:hypothetical protein